MDSDGSHVIVTKTKAELTRLLAEKRQQEKVLIENSRKS